MARGSGFTALCAYRGDLCPEALSEVASVHPLVRAPEGVPPFQVFHDGNGVVLTGSVDTFTAGRLGSVLAESPAARPATVLDIGRLDFIDVAGCRVLATWAQGLDRSLEVTGASRLLQRMWQLLALDQVTPITFTGARA
jgi:anti-anti-sigma regulatory factor